MNKRGDSWYLQWKVWVAVVVVVIVLYLAWLFFTGYVECEDRECFNANLVPCIKTKYLGGDSMIYEYIILGKNKNLCEVQVTLVQGELSNQDSKALEGKTMVCNLPLGVVMNPESSIENCHGPLKEGLQDLIIQKLHTYIVQNLGRINLEVLDLPTAVPEA